MAYPNGEGVIKLTPPFHNPGYATAHLKTILQQEKFSSQDKYKQ